MCSQYFPAVASNKYFTPLDKGASDRSHRRYKTGRKNSQRALRRHSKLDLNCSVNFAVFPPDGPSYVCSATGSVLVISARLHSVVTVVVNDFFCFRIYFIIFYLISILRCTCAALLCSPPYINTLGSMIFIQ